jgi:hypothetical protein
MSARKSKKENTDWSMKDLNEIERNNVLGFFGLLLKVDKRVNPHLYANNGNTSNTNQAE